MVVLTNFPPPTEGIKLEQPLTSVFVDRRELGKGTLYIAESRLSWVNSQTQQGFSIEYPHVVVHGICKDLREFPHECVLLLLDTCLEDEKDSESGDESHSDGAGSVIHFVPDDKGVLDAMYKAMVFCQELHPDPQESFSDDDLCEDAESEGEETIGNGHSHNGNERQNGVRTGDEEGEAMDVEEDGQFEDAD